MLLTDSITNLRHHRILGLLLLIAKTEMDVLCKRSLS